MTYSAKHNSKLRISQNDNTESDNLKYLSINHAICASISPCITVLYEICRLSLLI